MSDFKAKMHHVRFRLGLRPRPRWGSLQRSPQTRQLDLRGPTSKGKKGKGRDGGAMGEKKGKKGREMERGREGEGMGRGNLPPLKIRSGYATGPDN